MNIFLMAMCAAVLLVGVFLIHRATYVGEVLLGWLTVMLALLCAFLKFA